MKVLSRHPDDVPIEPRDPPAIQEQNGAAQTLDGRDVVAHEEDRPARVRHRLDPTKALLLKLRVAYCQDLVDQENLRLQMRGHGEGQPHIHP